MEEKNRRKNKQLQDNLCWRTESSTINREIKNWNGKRSAYSADFANWTWKGSRSSIARSGIKWGLRWWSIDFKLAFPNCFQSQTFLPANPGHPWAIYIGDWFSIILEGLYAAKLIALALRCEFLYMFVRI